ncbi:Putative odorant-binding protein [Gryllus bimaculatus]|nr:Putative odorant-binding protein [Gryllus bimaculatus]
MIRNTCADPARTYLPALTIRANDGRLSPAKGAPPQNERRHPAALFRPRPPAHPARPAPAARGTRAGHAARGALLARIVASSHRVSSRRLGTSITMISRCVTAAAAALLVGILCICEAHGAALAAENESPSYSEQMNSDLKNIRDCNHTFPIGLAAMNAVLVHQRLTGVGDENFQCFLHCLYIKYGWMDEEGSFLLGVVRTALRGSDLPPSAAQWLLYRCTSTRASDPCERALEFTRCFWTEAQEAPQHDDSFDFDQAFKQSLFDSKPRS